MKVLIKRAKIMDKGSLHDGHKMDILISKGKIEKIAKSITVKGKINVIEHPNLRASIGWFDIGTHVGEPGLEHRETLLTSINAARQGGYTGFAPFPNTIPVLQQKVGVKNLIDTGKELNFRIVPISAASTDTKGKELTEMYDMHTNGAIAFSDGLQSLSDGMMLNVLNYVKAFDGMVIHHPKNKTLSMDGQMHEGIASTKLGLKGNPTMSETVKLQRDIALLQYTEANLCVYGVSAGESVKLILAAKKNTNIKATVPYLNLIRTDNDLLGFDNNLKVNPPLRSSKDQKELWKGLNNNALDAIVSNHVPLEIELKKKEFSFADFGASGIETTFAALNTFKINSEEKLHTVIYKLSIGPRKILNLPIPSIKVGEDVDITLFDNSTEWLFEKTKSKSNNNPFLGKSLKGKVHATLLRSKVYRNN